MSIVEETLRSQRETWKEVVERTLRISDRELPPEPPKRILLFGIGSSHHAARLTAYALIRDKSKVRVPIFASSSLGIGMEVIPTKGDWAFGFSHRGKTPVTLKALETCDRAGAYTFLVAGREMAECPFAKMTLETGPQERCEPHTLAVTSAICAVTTLLIGPKAAEEWDALRSVGDPSLDAIRERVGKGPEVVLGEWEAEWIAREAALKVMEMAKLPARAYSSEEFFHGPKWALGETGAIWHVADPKDARSDEIRSRNTVSIFGRTPLAWIPALVETQWMALAVALNRGVDPDLPEARK